jgi:CRP/FNR family transcriptional regulator
LGYGLFNKTAARMNTIKEREQCRVCNRREACRNWDLGAKVREQLDGIAEHSGPIVAGTRLWEWHDPILAVHIVRSGSFKCCRSSDDHEQTLGFTFPTEMVGIDGIYTGLHQSNAVALEESRLCSFKLSRLQPLMGQYPDLSALILRIVSNTLRHPDLDGGRSPQQRVAGFLVNLSKRARRRGELPDAIHLPMSHREIGSYLHLPPETVSAELTHLARHRHIELETGRVRVLEPGHLEQAASV